MNSEFEPMAPLPRLPETPPPVVPQSLTYPFWNYEDVALFFGMSVPCLVLSVVVMEGLFWFLPVKPERSIQLLTAQFIGYGLLFASLVLLLRVRYEAPFWASLAWVIPSKGLWRWAILGPVLAFSLAGLAQLMRSPSIDLPFQEMMSGRYTIMLTGLFFVIIGPLSEELAFRGFLMPVLQRTFGAPIGILLTTLPFALLHGPQYSWSWRHLLLLMLASMVFGWVRHLTGSTAAAVLTHGAYNMTFFAALVVAQI